MKRNYLLLSFLFFLSLSASVRSQTIEYTYDNAGNRKTRQVIILEALMASPDMVKKHTEAPATEILGERNIKVYPNPTKGDLSIEVTGGNEKEKVEVQLSNAQGVQLQAMKVDIGKTPIDMVSYPAGWYILRVGSGDKIKEIKIIKQ